MGRIGDARRGLAVPVRPIGPRSRAALWTAGGAVWLMAAKRLSVRHPLLEKGPAQPPPPRLRQKASIPQLIKEAAARWLDHEGPRRGAALSYYTIFSVGPLILIVVTIVGFALGPEAAQGVISEQLEGFLGSDKAEAIEGMVESAQKPGAGLAAGLIGFATLLLGAGAVVGELQTSLMRMWGTVPKKSGLKTLVRNRLVSAAFVLALGFLMLVSLIVNAATAAAGKYLEVLLPIPEPAMQLLATGLSFGAIALVFAMIFKYLPRAQISWGDVWIGALSTAAMFALGNQLLGHYLGKATSSAYGAAGSLLAFMLWGYYCAQILYFGAEFTRAYAEKRGSGFASGTAPG